MAKLGASWTIRHATKSTSRSPPKDRYWKKETKASFVESLRLRCCVNGWVSLCSCDGLELAVDKQNDDDDACHSDIPDESRSYDIFTHKETHTHTDARGLEKGYLHPSLAKVTSLPRRLRYPKRKLLLPILRLLPNPVRFLRLPPTGTRLHLQTK